MVFIGGLGSILGSFLGAAFIVLTPIVLNQIPGWLGIPMSTALISHLEFMVFGAMIVFFLIVESHGLARSWRVLQEKWRPSPLRPCPGTQPSANPTGQQRTNRE